MAYYLGTNGFASPSTKGDLSVGPVPTAGRLPKGPLHAVDESGQSLCGRSGLVKLAKWSPGGDRCPRCSTEVS